MASFCFSDLHLRKAHTFSNEIHKRKTRPSPTYLSSKLQRQRGASSVPSESTKSPHLPKQFWWQMWGWPKIAYTLNGFRLPKDLLRSHDLGAHDAIWYLCTREGGGRMRTNHVTVTSLRPIHLQKWTREEGSPSFRIKLFSPLQLFPRKWGRHKWNVLEILWKFLYIYIQKFT